MRLLCVLCVLILIAFATGAAQTSIENSQSEDEKCIRSSESEWAESVATNDSSVVERIFADDCVWVLDGRILTKAQAVADAKNGPGIFYPIIWSTPTCGFLEGRRSFRGAKSGLAKEAARGALSGQTHGFDETDNGKSWLPRTFPCRPGTRISVAEKFLNGLEAARAYHSFQ
jgi:hypothetical protein